METIFYVLNKDKLRKAYCDEIAIYKQDDPKERKWRQAAQHWYSLVIRQNEIRFYASEVQELTKHAWWLDAAFEPHCACCGEARLPIVDDEDHLHPVWMEGTASSARSAGEAHAACNATMEAAFLAELRGESPAPVPTK